MMIEFLQFLMIFLTNIVSNVNIPQYEDPSVNFENISNAP